MTHPDLPGLLRAREVAERELLNADARNESWVGCAKIICAALDAAILEARQSEGELTPEQAVDILEASEKGLHRWFVYRPGWPESCEFCGIVRRADDKNSPCKGVVHVGLRAQPNPGLSAPARVEGAEYYATDLEQCALVCDSEPLAKAMTEAAAFIRLQSKFPSGIARANYTMKIERLESELAALRSSAGTFEEGVEAAALVVERWSLPTIQAPSMWLIDKAGIAATIRALSPEKKP